MAYSKSKRDYNMQYIKDNIKRIPLDVQKEHYERIKAASDVTGESVNGYIKRAIDERMERDSPQEAAGTPSGAGVVSLPSDVLKAAQAAAEDAGEALADFLARAVSEVAERDRLSRNS